MHLTPRNSPRLLGGAPKYPESAQDYLHRPIRVQNLSTTSASTVFWSNRETTVFHNVDLWHQNWEMDPWNWITDASFGGVSIIGVWRRLPISSHVA